MPTTISVSSNPDARDPYAFTFEERLQQIIDQKVSEKIAEDRQKRKAKTPYDSGEYIALKQSKDNELALYDLMDKNPLYMKILLYIMNRVRYNNVFECSQETMAEYLGVSKSSISRAVNYLKDHNYIDFKKLKGRYIYYLNRDLAFKGYSKNARFCEVHGTILMSSKEVLK